MERQTRDGKTLRIFLKGNDDLVNALLPGAGDGNRLPQDGSNWIQQKFSGTHTFTVTREECGRSDLLLQQHQRQPIIPTELHQRKLFTPAQLATQFKSHLFETAPDVIVFSLQPEVTNALWRQHNTGDLIHLPAGRESSWSAEQRAWFQEQFEPVGLLNVETFKRNLVHLIQAVRARTQAHVIVFNASSVVPEDVTYNYHKVVDTVAQRISRFNLALMQVSAQTGISIVDVDRIVAEQGAGQHVLAPFCYSAAVNKALQKEFVRVLIEIGALERPNLLKLRMRAFNREMHRGSIIRWHKQEGDPVNYGDALFDMKVEEFKKMRRSSNPLFLSNATPDELRKGSYVDTINRTLFMRVTASDTGVLQRIHTQAGDRWRIGTLLAVLSIGENIQIDEEQALKESGTFQVVANLTDSL